MIDCFLYALFMCDIFYLSVKLRHILGPTILHLILLAKLLLLIPLSQPPKWDLNHLNTAEFGDSIVSPT